MKITGIEIEKFGKWNHFTQDLHPSGLTFFYGPNEAGKTTLLRFIRAMLYGFRVDDFGEARRRVKSERKAGVLRLEHRGQTFEIRRQTEQDDRGQVDIAGCKPGESTQRRLDEITSGTDEKLFESVFAVGLNELQEFSTLTEEQVATHLYGMTLGPQGRLLMDLPHRVDQELARLLHIEGGECQIGGLIRRREELQSSLSTVRKLRDRYRELQKKRTVLHDRIEELKTRQSTLNQNLRGLQFLDRVSVPWQRMYISRQELVKLPDPRSFPVDALERLDRIDNEQQRASSNRDALLDEARALAERWKSRTAEPVLRRYGSIVESLRDQGRLLEETESQLYDLRKLVAAHQENLDRHLSELGPTWNVERIDRLPDSPADHARLVQAAREYIRHRDSTGRWERRLTRLSTMARDRELALKTQLLEFGVQPEEVQSSVDLARQRINEIGELGRLQLLAEDYARRMSGTDEQLQKLTDHHGLPDWVFVILIVFTLGGLALFAAGLAAALRDAWVVGLIYVFLSAVAGGTAWAFKHHFEAVARRQVSLLRDLRREWAEARHAAIQNMEELARKQGLFEGRKEEVTTDDLTSGDLLAFASQRVATLEWAQHEYLRIQALRRKLESHEGKTGVHKAQRSHAKKNWLRCLLDQGYDATPDVNAGFAQWQAIQQARAERARIVAIHQELDQHEREWGRFCRRVDDLAKRVERADADLSDPRSLLESWDRELAAIRARRQERLEGRRTERKRRQEASRFHTQIGQLEADRTQLFEQARVGSRRELEQKVAQLQRRKQLEATIAAAQQEVEAIAQSDPELAIVESDLIRFSPEENAERVRAAKQDQKQLESQLHESFEQLGIVKQEMKSLEEDRRGCSARFELGQLEGSLKEAWNQWYALTVAGGVIEEVEARFELANQPEMLAAAIPFLQRLTCNKYQRLWAQLGRKQLFVDDSLGRTRPAEQLSGGTREQLFLAIRLAMVRGLSRQGIELPMVLDDVTVNFDQQRAEAAVETFIDFAKDGQQLIVFSSHEFMAELFEQRGIQPIRLPSTPTGVEGRRAG